MITRRMILMAGAALMPALALAHEGHGDSRILADVISAERLAGGARVTLRLTNTGHAPAILLGAFSDAASIRFAGPVTLGEGEEALVVLDATGVLPGIFTVMLDFGPDGSGPVVVML